MSATYVEARPEVYSLVESVLSEHFSVLASVDPSLKFEVLMAEDDKGKPAIRVHGHACAGKIKLVSLEERAAAQGVPDIRITLDSRRWEKLSARRRQALLHHELSHLALRLDKRSGEVKRDDYGRPRLRLKLGDWMLTGFQETAAIFGEDALEIQAIRKVSEILSQKFLPFGDTSSPGPKAKKPKAKKPKAKPAAATVLADHPAETEAA